LKKLTTQPLPQPAIPANVSADVVSVGPPIPPIERIKLFGPSQWEEFIWEWVDSLRMRYRSVEKCAGAGDMGRDIVCAISEQHWDNYQCKHYDHPLQPSDIWIEVGKLAYYTKAGAYEYPQTYFFIAPQGVGTKLSNLLKKPDELRKQLLVNWDKYCRDQITSSHAVELDDDLRDHINSLDFSIFHPVSPLRILDEHGQTRWHVARFGGGLPVRPTVAAPPPIPTSIETRYVRRLFEAYGDHQKRPITSMADIANDPKLKEHFNDSRLEFYSAESLRAFSRDTLPPRAFEQLQDDVHAGIRDEIRRSHPDGYERLLAVVALARLLPLAAHALISRMTVRDRGGICHQLANDDKINWVE
jgi:hypothetical protein